MKKLLATTFMSVLLVCAFALGISAASITGTENDYISLTNFKVVNQTSAGNSAVYVAIGDDAGNMYNFTAGNTLYNQTYVPKPQYITMLRGVWIVKTSNAVDRQRFAESIPTSASLLYYTDKELCFAYFEYDPIIIDDDYDRLQFVYIADNNNSLYATPDSRYDEGYLRGQASKVPEIRKLTSQLAQLQASYDSLTAGTTTQIQALRERVRIAEQAAAEAYNQGAADNTGDQTISSAIKLAFNGFARVMTSIMSITIIGIPIWSLAIIPCVLGIVVFAVKHLKG